MLATLVVAGYAALIGAMAFAPDWLAHPVSRGSIINRGLAGAMAFALLVLAATGGYVWWRNRLESPGHAGIRAAKRAPGPGTIT